MSTGRRLPDITAPLPRAGYGLLGLGMIVLAWWLMGQGMAGLSESRQLARLNVTPNADLAGGTYLVGGRIDPDVSGFVNAPYSGERVVWVEYREERRTGSGDNRRWRTVNQGTYGVPRIGIQDASGLVVLDTMGAFLADGRLISQRGGQGAEWDLPQTYQRRDGDRRYTERALFAHPDRIEATGRYDTASGTLQLVNGHVPSHVTYRGITHLSEEAQMWALAMLGGAVLLLGLGTGLVVVALGIYTFWLFIAVMSGVIVTQLVIMGSQHMADDWQASMQIAHERAEAVSRLGAAQQAGPRRDLGYLMGRMQESAGGFIDHRHFVRAAGELGGLAQSPDSDAQGPSGILDSRGKAVALGGAAFGLLVTFALLKEGLRQVVIKRLMEALPWNRSGRLSYGMTKKSGVAEPVEELLAPPFGEDGVLAYVEVTQERRGSGKRKRWETTSRQVQIQPFRIRGDDGADVGALVLPTEDSLDFANRRVRVTRFAPEQRVITHWLRPGEQVTVLGHAGLNPDDPAELALQPEQGTPFIVSARSPRHVVAGLVSQGFLSVAAGFAAFLFGVASLLALMGNVTPDTLLVLVLAVPAFLAILTVALHYNDLVRLRNAVTTRRQHILTQLKKRADLIPALESIVKQHFAYERELLRQIAEVREDGDAGVVGRQVEGAIAKQEKLADTLRIRGEAHPDLLSASIVEQFMTTLDETESYLAFLRGAHQQSIELYNTRIRSFPDMLIARPFGFKPASYTFDRTQGES